MYFGFCAEDRPPPPLCVHAYAVRGDALPKLVNNVYPCAPEMLDDQLQRLGRSGLLSYHVVDVAALGFPLLAPQRTGWGTKGLFYQESWRR